MHTKYIFSERPHLMCPNMLIGLKFNVYKEYINLKAQKVLDLIADAHPFLKSTLKHKKDFIIYSISEKSTIEFHEINNKTDFMNDYKNVSETYWDVFNEGLLKIFVYPQDKCFTVLMVAHHLLGDGKSIAQLMNEFAILYNDGEIHKENERTIISGIKDLPVKSDLTGLNNWYINFLNKKWNKEQHRITQKEYKNFFRKFVVQNPVSYMQKIIASDKLQSIILNCKNNDVKVNSAILSAFSIAAETKTIGIGVDIRNKLTSYKEDTIGNFASALSISCKGSKDCYQRAKTISKRVDKKIKDNRKLMLLLSCYMRMSPLLIDAMFPSCFNGYKSKTAKKAGKMFGYNKQNNLGITNLGKYKISNIGDVIFIPPASPSNFQTVGVITVNNEMSFCSSFYSNNISLKTIENQINSAVKLLLLTSH